ncbi:DUF2637 domain-containing protein [Streptomyces xiamenensis]
MADARTAPIGGEARGGLRLRRMTFWDRSAIVLLGAAGMAFSYDALRQIAIAIHARESLSYLFPVFIDGFIAYGVRAIVLLRHQRFGARLYAWVLFLTATGASLGANALHAITLNQGSQAGRSALYLTDSVVGVLSTLAPLALAGSVHLYILMARTAELSVPDGPDGGPGPVRRGVPAFGDVTVPAWSGPLEKAPPAGRRTGPFANTDEPDQADGPPAAPADHGADPHPPAAGGSPSPAEVGGGEDGEEDAVRDGSECPQDRDAADEWLADLLPIARTASERAGRVSRAAVAEAIRVHRPISNADLGVLLARLKEEEEAGAVETPAATPTAVG